MFYLTVDMVCEVLLYLFSLCTVEGGGTVKLAIPADAFILYNLS